MYMDMALATTPILFPAIMAGLLAIPTVFLILLFRSQGRRKACWYTTTMFVFTIFGWSAFTYYDYSIASFSTTTKLKIFDQLHEIPNSSLEVCAREVRAFVEHQSARNYRSLGECVNGSILAQSYENMLAKLN